MDKADEKQFELRTPEMAVRWTCWIIAVLIAVIVSSIFIIILCSVVLPISTAQRLDDVLYEGGIPLDRGEVDRRLPHFKVVGITIDDIPAHYRRWPVPASWEYQSKSFVRYSRWGQSVIVGYDDKDRVTTLIAEYE